MIIAGIYREQLFSYLYIHDEVTACVDMIQLRVELNGKINISKYVIGCGLSTSSLDQVWNGPRRLYNSQEELLLLLREKRIKATINLGGVFYYSYTILDHRYTGWEKAIKDAQESL